MLCAFFLLTAFGLDAQTHPSLIMTKSGVETIRKGLAVAPLFEKSLRQAQREVEIEMELGIDVPVPKDMAGGYTHERHKQNFFILQKAGALFQITGDEKYARYVRDMLLAYAKLYPTLPLHPTNKSYATGKLFWQCLNDANWLVYVSQAYDCIYDWLPAKQREHLERDLFRPYADFLSTGSPQFFNRIHNHSTWGNAAVGMIGLVMNDQELIQRALYGLGKDDLSAEARDNDGGLIKLPGHDEAGFFAQLDFAFSPDGYYTEGPYYQRYAIYPFILFAKALENKRPDLKIFEYREGLLKKAVYALLWQTDAEGAFFPINDAQKGMSVKSRELIAAVDIVYHDTGRDPTLLSVVQNQGRVELDQTGFTAALDIALGKAKPFYQRSIELRDGPDGQSGALGILRAPVHSRELTAVFKYTSQGLGHGHFDKLSISVFDGGTEVLQDYGAARWVNIDQKAGGRYLPENTTWAKQTIAHNTAVVDEKSHFGGDFELGNQHHSDPYFFMAEDPGFQVASAKDSHAYPDVDMHRTICLLTDTSLGKPILIDVFALYSATEHQYDLPIHYKTQLLETDIPYRPFTDQLIPMGAANGYQHAWKEAEANLDSANYHMTWFSDGKFFSLTALSAKGDQVIFGRPGAKDPNFNLRREPFLVHRKKAAKDAVFVSVLEPHGEYAPENEIPFDPYPSVTTVELIHHDQMYTLVQITDKNENHWTLMLANQDASKTAKHQLLAGGKKYSWVGPAALEKNRK